MVLDSPHDIEAIIEARNKNILVSQDRVDTRENHFQALFWGDFLRDLWDDKFT